MNDNVFSEDIRKSSTSIESEFDLISLCEKRGEFVNCNAEFKDEKETVVFTYDTTGLFSFEELGKTRIDKIRFLLSVQRLEAISKRFVFSLQPENLFFDANLNAKVLRRDVIGDDEHADFLLQYKSLIGTVMMKQYSYQDFYEGGLSLMDKDKFLSQVKSCTTTQEIVSLLFEQFTLEKEKALKTVSVPKKKQTINKIALRVFVVLSVLLLVLNLYQFMFINKDQGTELKAMSHYVDNNYVDTIDTLESTSTDSLSKESMYILAVSHIKSSGLNDEAKSNALSQIKLNGNESYSKFWVLLGRKEFDDAYDIANKFSDDRLLYYAYSVEYSSLNTNTELSSEEKATRKGELEKLIDDYIEKVSENEESEK